MISAIAKHVPDSPYSSAISASDQPARSGIRVNRTTTTPNSITLMKNEPNSASRNETLYCIWLRNWAPISRPYRANESRTLLTALDDDSTCRDERQPLSREQQHQRPHRLQADQSDRIPALDAFDEQVRRCLDKASEGEREDNAL